MKGKGGVGEGPTKDVDGNKGGDEREYRRRREDLDSVREGHEGGTD